MTATLLLVWRFQEKGMAPRTQLHEFMAEPGEMSTLCREVAACMEVIDGGAAFWRGVAGDLEGEVLRLKNELRQANDSLDFWLERKPVGAMSA